MTRRGALLGAALVMGTLLMLHARPATAYVSLGSSLGFSHLGAAGQSSSTWAIPGDLFSLQPGLRVGMGDRGSGLDVALDLSVLITSGETYRQQHYLVVLHGQYSLLHDRRTSPFASADLGLQRIDFLDEELSYTRSVFGAGIGVRRLVADDHGVLRAELRFDRLVKVPELNIEGTNLLGIKLGFDLLMGSRRN